jgi:hypothetical protein
MKTKYLFPNAMKIPGWIFFVIGIVILFSCIGFDLDQQYEIEVNMPAIISEIPFDKANSGVFRIIKNSIYDEVAFSLILIGAMFIAFSKEKHEDEYIMQLRLESLVWAFLVNTAIMLFCIIFFYGLAFYSVMMFNIISISILFLLKFKLALIKGAKYEKQD